MTWRRTLLFLSILAALSSFYFLRVHQNSFLTEPFALSKKLTPASVLTLEKGDVVSRFTLKNAARETEISFEREGERLWRIVRPVDYPAESLVIEGLVTLLRLTPRYREFSLEGISATEFGFDTPRLSLCLSTNGTPHERCLLIGSTAAVADGAYAKWQDESKYFLVDRNFLAACDKTLYAVRKKQIFGLLEEGIKSIQFRSSNFELQMKHEDKQWTVTKPTKTVLSSESVNQALTLLNGLYVKEFLDGESWENPELGFKKSRQAIRIEFQDGSEQTLIRGSEAAGRDAYYARLNNEDTVLLISMGKLNKIEEAFRALIA